MVTQGFQHVFDLMLATLGDQPHCFAPLATYVSDNTLTALIFFGNKRIYQIQQAQPSIHQRVTS
jgi:hypothetical protein